MSTEKTLTQDFAEMMHIVGYVQKDAENKFHKYGYASANAVFTKVREELSKRGIAIVRDTEKSRIVWQNETGTNVIYDWVGYFTRGSEAIRFCGMGQGSDKTDKAVMKAQTAALKYALAGTFLISWGDDPENEAAAPSEAPTKKRKPPVKKPRGAVKKDPVDVQQILVRIEESKSLNELDEIIEFAKRLTISEPDKPVLNEAYQAKRTELSV